jgi:hypothetical protein
MVPLSYFANLVAETIAEDHGLQPSGFDPFALRAPS